MPSSSGSSCRWSSRTRARYFSSGPRRPAPYRPSFYLHIGVLHLWLIVRIVGDLVDVLGRGWGGLLNAVALLLFMVNTGRSMALGGMRGESH